MNFYERQRLMSALILLAIGLFVAPVSEPWRRRLRLASALVFGVGVLLALADIARWLADGVD